MKVTFKHPTTERNIELENEPWKWHDYRETFETALNRNLDLDTEVEFEVEYVPYESEHGTFVSNPYGREVRLNANGIINATQFALSRLERDISEVVEPGN